MYNAYVFGEIHWFYTFRVNS